MARRGHGTKRKNEFIYEVDDKDLSSDEDGSVRESPSKIIKIEDESIATSKTKSSPRIKNESFELNSPVHSVSRQTNKKNKSESGDVKTSTPTIEMSESDEMNKSQTCDEKNSTSKGKSKKKKSKKLDNAEVTEIGENTVDQNSSVIIIEEPIATLEISDDNDPEEEGEIIEDLEVIDEVFATPKPKVSPQQASNDINKESKIGEETENAPKENKNLINMSFDCQNTMNEYGHLIVKFLKTFPEFEIKTDKLCIRVNEKERFSEMATTPKKKNKKKKSAKKDLFVVDTNPSTYDDEICSEFRYTSKFTIGDDEEEEESVTTKSRSKQSCFNCDGNHGLRECTAPRNYRKINQARQQFLDRNKTVRYHGEQTQKFADFKPGVISDNLRMALGLDKNQLPDHIYRMRQLGYPPGWLEEARVSRSDLNLFDIHGEKVESEKTINRSIDPEKIVEYPGFNMPLRKGFYDDFRRHRVKPYNKSMHKSAMIKYYEDQYQRENQINSSEILVESSSDENKSETGIIKKKSFEKKVKDLASVPVNSPTLVDLEEKKKEIINQLNSSEESQEPVKPSTNDTDCSQDEVEEASGKEEHKTAIKSTTFGTPILKSSSPYSCLPNPDNFSVGVSPVIDFENLPNSTGKYEDLSKILSKVRMKMKNLL